MIGALVDAASGDLLWFNIAASHGAHDLRQDEDALALARRIFTDFKSPRARP